MVDLFFFE